MNSLALIVLACACAVPVLIRGFCIVARVPKRGWSRWRHFAFTLAGPCFAVGALGVVIGAEWGGQLLLAGLALSIVLDRRQRRDRRMSCN